VNTGIDHDRRRFLGTAAMAITGTHYGRLGRLGAGGALGDLTGPLAEARGLEGQQRPPREIAAIASAAEWLNSPRLTAEGMLGRVVLVNFWTYTCINWMRQLPYLRAWAQKYRDTLVVIGVHTPEFAFEQNVDNVRRAVRQMKIEYAVVTDNDYAIWRAFRNQYWPALYFIDPRGRVRDSHFGEGEYEQSEKTIRRMLVEAGTAGVREGSSVSIVGEGVETPADWANLKSPEAYVGYDRLENFASPGGPDRDRRRLYTAPVRMALNQWALSGEWTIGKQATVLSNAGGRIVHRFHARDVHLVMGPARQQSEVRFRVSLDGQRPGAARGLDINEDGDGTLAEPRMHQLVRQSRPITDRTFEIEFLGAGVEAFAFTFG